MVGSGQSVLFWHAFRQNRWFIQLTQLYVARQSAFDVQGCTQISLGMPDSSPSLTQRFCPPHWLFEVHVPEQ